MAEYVEFEGKFYRVCTVKYNGIKVSNALIPEDEYKEKKQEKKISAVSARNHGFNYAKRSLWPIFSDYIRARGDYVCVTCGAVGKQSSRYNGGESRIIQAGHYFPKSAYSGIYFDERNVHCQCAICNMNMEDPKVKNAYTDFMIKEYGIETIEMLKIEGKRHKLSASELELLKLDYQKKLKELG